MELQHTPLEKLKTLRRAMDYEPNNPDAQPIAVALFGITHPIYLNRSTGGTILNPLDLDAILSAQARGATIPEKIPCLIVDVAPCWERPISIMLSGGLDGWLYGIPTRYQDVIAAIKSLMEHHPKAVNVLGLPFETPEEILDYIADVKRRPERSSRADVLAQTKPEITPDNYDIPILDPALQIYRAAPKLDAMGQRGAL